VVTVFFVVVVLVTTSIYKIICIMHH